MKRYLLPKLSDILFISLLATILLFGPRTFNLDGDLGRHITIGNYILNTRTIPQFDLFSHTMKFHSLTPHEWLAQVLFALSHRSLSLAGMVLLTAIVVSSAFVLTFRECVQRSSTVLISLTITILAAAAASLHWLARPHIFTFLYLAIWVSMLERIRTRNNSHIWIFGLVMLLWANTHGAFIAGFVTWGAYLSEELIEGLIHKEWNSNKLMIWMLIGALSFGVTFINPAGGHLWETSVGFVGNRYLVSHTQEYLPPDFHNPGVWPFLLLLTVSLFMLGIKKIRLPFSHSLLLTGWAALALYSARNIPLFAIVVAPILSSTAASLLSGMRHWAKIESNILNIEQSLRGGMWSAIIIIFSVMLLFTPSMQKYNSFDESIFPVNAVEWLENNPQEGNIFNHFPWGGYLLYRQWPDTLVFIDGQTDFYGEDLTREYELVISVGEGWEQVLQKYDVAWSLIPENSALAVAFEEHTSWQILYEDDTSKIFIKNE